MIIQECSSNKIQKIFPPYHLLIFHSTWYKVFQTDEHPPYRHVLHYTNDTQPIQNSAYSLFTLALYLFDAFVYGF